MAFASSDQLNWNVVTQPLTYLTGGGERRDVPNKVVQLRDDNYDVLGITSPTYSIFQNDELKLFVEPLVEEGLLEVVNIGYLGTGSKVYIQARMSEAYTVVGEEHRAMISLLNAHDGTAALAAGVTDTRVICGNTFAMAMGDMSTRLRHNATIYDESRRITEIVDFVNSGMARFAERAEALASHRVVGSELDDIISNAYGKPVENVRAANSIRRLFRTGAGNEGKTLWDAVNAITDYTTHEAIKNDGKRFASVNFGRNAEVNRRALEAALVYTV